MGSQNWVAGSCLAAIVDRRVLGAQEAFLFVGLVTWLFA